MKNDNPGPSGSRGPVTRSRLASSSIAQPPAGFACEFPGCSRSFDTKTGRGLHHRRAHPDWYDAQQNIEPVKARWNEEETLLIARKEVELIKLNTKFINQALVLAFPNRTLEGIKGKRKQLAYKQLVERLLAESSEEDPETAEPENVPQYKQDIIAYLQGLPVPPEDGDFKAFRLCRICDSLSSSSPEEAFAELSLYLLNAFPPKARKTNRAAPQNAKAVSKKVARKANYARTQDLWRKNRSKCLRMLLNDVNEVKYPSKDIMVPFWEKVMTAGEDISPGGTELRPILHNLWAPIQQKEIRKALPANTTASGPDGVTARLLKKVPTTILCRIFNIILWCGRAPTYLLESITTLIPKKSRASEPADFRPITVSSVMLRVFHKVLAVRMAGEIELDQRQKAFVPVDGCSENTFVLDLLLRHHNKMHKQLFIASLDIAKAFDSLAHRTISETLEVSGVPRPMIDYIMDVYSKSSTRLYCNNWTSNKITPTCGVKQGDPMSPIIFNMVIDRMLRQLPTDVGARVGEMVINAAAFADDLLLFASTPLGLQKLLDVSADFLGKCGLRVSAAKCLTVALRNVPHEKKTIIDRDTVFLCQGRVLPSLKRTDEWCYLGIPFTPDGKAKINVVAKLCDAILKLSKAPLKPQQRLFALRTMIVPGLYHQLELGSINISMLRKCDGVLRHAVRMWLSLPSDVPNAYIHADVKDGGLGIPSLRWNAPVRRLQRLLKMPLAQRPLESAPSAFWSAEIKRCEERLKENNIVLRDLDQVKQRWSTQLYQRVDGKGLKDAARVLRQHDWVRDGTRFLSGRDYLQSCKLRINALPTRSRTSRGRVRDRFCRAGCNYPETLNHVIQQCHRTHSARINRHDAVAAYVAQKLEKKDYVVHVEPRIETPEGIRKPDLVAVRGNMALVIDAQVVNDQINLNDAHKKKVEYYSRITGQVRSKYKVSIIIVTSITLSWRGLWSDKSAGELIRHGVIHTGSLKVISSRAIIGGVAAFNMFNRTTVVKKRN